MEKELAIITGADGGMGQEITKEIARAGYPIIMACKNAQKATPICEQIKKETGITPASQKRAYGGQNLMN